MPTLAGLGVDVADWRAAIPTRAQQALDSGSPANNPVVPSHAEICALDEGIHPGA